ncbi:MAG: hypothetical protein WCF98_12580, partial [Synechococcus sp. ELA057]
MVLDRVAPAPVTGLTEGLGALAAVVVAAVMAVVAEAVLLGAVALAWLFSVVLPVATPVWTAGLVVALCGRWEETGARL